MSQAFSDVQIVVLSSIDWNAAWQRHQIFASQLAQAGHEVFFIENTGFRNPHSGDLPRVWGRLRGLAAPRRGGRDQPPRLRVIPAPMLPPTFPAFRRANAAAFIPNLVAGLREAGLRRRALLIAYLPTVTTLELLRQLDPSAVVYDCASNFRAHPQVPQDFRAVEEALLRRADLVVCDSDFLLEQKRGEHPRVVQIHQGVSEKFFRAAPPDPGFRRFCYYGTWVPDLDCAFLAALAQAGFEVTVSGFVRGRAPKWPAGVHRLGPVPVEGLVERLERFDAFLLPHRLTPFHQGVIPAKIYECLAMGRPVLATPLPSLAAFSEHIHTAPLPEQWVDTARRLPETETEERRRARIALARQHTHAREFARFNDVLRQAWDRGRDAPRPPAARAPWLGRRHIRAFLSGFGWIGLLYGLAKTSTLLTQIAAGRFLGPLAYGNANLVVAAAAFLQILPMLGFQWALSKFPSSSVSSAAQRSLISTTLTMFTGWALLCLLALGLLSPRLSSLLGTPPGISSDAVIFAFCTAFYVVFSSPLLGLQRFAERGLAEAVYGLSAPLFLAAFIIYGTRTYHAMIMALCLALGTGAAVAMWSLRSYLRPVWDPAAVRTVRGYAVVAGINLLTAACVVAPGRLLLNRFFTAHEVGVFSAYFTATAQISLAFLYIVTSVLVPVASQPEGQEEGWRSFRELRLPLAAGAWLFFVAVAAAAFAVFGRQYPFRWDWTALFASAATLILLHGIMGALFLARDFSGLRVSVVGNLIAGCANVGLGLWLVPRWGVSGAGAALAGAYLAGLAYFRLAPRGRDRRRSIEPASQSLAQV